MGQRTLAVATCALLLACACGPSGAKQPGDTLLLTASARVREHVGIRLLGHPPHVDITEEDVRRRYVDVDSPLKIEVVSNLPQGIDLHFETGGQVVLGASAVSSLPVTPRRGSGLERELLEVHLRLVLAADARPGRHAWPIHVTFSPR